MAQGKIRTRVIYNEGAPSREGLIKFVEQQKAQKTSLPGVVQATQEVKVICGINATNCRDYSPTACLAQYRCIHKRLVKLDESTVTR